MDILLRTLGRHEITENGSQVEDQKNKGADHGQHLCAYGISCFLYSQNHLNQMFRISLSNPETFDGLHPAFLLLLSGSFLLFCIALPP